MSFQKKKGAYLGLKTLFACLLDKIPKHNNILRTC